MMNDMRCAERNDTALRARYRLQLGLGVVLGACLAMTGCSTGDDDPSTTGGSSGTTAGAGGSAGSGGVGGSGGAGSGGSSGTGGGSGGSGGVQGGGSGGTSGTSGSGGAGMEVDGGGYEPCAGKQCGDSCELCDPSDPSCMLSDAALACDASGACVAGGVECPEPAACDPQGANTCGEGNACCFVGRCGPIVIGDQGRCEPADPVTHDCKPCACESQPGGCPICNSPDTPIATPMGERPIAELVEGDLVLSMHGGELVAVPVIATGQMRVTHHAVVRLSLDNGRTIEVSGSHPSASGERLDALQPGDALGAVHVVAVELVPYGYDRTFDILPASDSATYLAGGALLKSTLAR